MFVNTLLKSTNPSPYLVASTLIYAERFFRQPGGDLVMVSTEAACRVFMVAMMTSFKFHADEYYMNKMWHKMVSPWLSIADLLQMERQFLQRVRYNLTISWPELSQVLQDLQGMH